MSPLGALLQRQFRGNVVFDIVTVNITVAFT